MAEWDLYHIQDLIQRLSDELFFENRDQDELQSLKFAVFGRGMLLKGSDIPGIMAVVVEYHQVGATR